LAFIFLRSSFALEVGSPLVKHRPSVATDPCAGSFPDCVVLHDVKSE
jgi:hypothetical protein